MWNTIGRLMFAAGSFNADPVGPNANVATYEVWEFDVVKSWYGAQWTNGDSTAYTQISEDGGSTVAYTMSPGVTQKAAPPYWTTGDVSAGGNLRIRHTKNGIALDWLNLSIAS